jgi:uncharacterized protein (DUF486 family)
MKLALVPALILLSGAFMATAWLAHLRFRDSLGFWSALAISWALVLPEYALNVFATRLGFGTFTGAQMASFHLCSGVVCVALVSRFVLGESMEARQLAGFVLLALGMVLVLRRH